ncbi:MAG TPA: branched-chain amino acid ABC transporter permease, partial [Reyranellaceae bacterium]|nr:branched-chain amino acid ABC transporter permease [Reyranellaceae bacterium]
MLFEVTLSGVTLGGMYALVAMGLTLQYGVARIMNLSYGELLIAAAFAALWFFTGLQVSPAIGLLIVPPIAFVASFAIYRLLLQPLVRRAASRDALEVDSILATFGLLFAIQGVMLAIFGGAYYSYSFLSFPVTFLGATVAANRLLALDFAVIIGLGLWLALTRARLGTAVRAVAVDPVAAELVAIDVRLASALAFALGGALVASVGVLVSMFLTFNANLGVVFTLKALVVVIMG